MSNISLSTALSVNNNWNPIFSLELCKKYNINYCQLYIGSNYNSKTINEINNYDLNFIFHSSHLLNFTALDRNEIEIINKINSKNKLVVYHHDPEIHIVEAVNIINNLNKRGITPLIENFYYNEKDVISTINHFVSLTKINTVNFYPLIDFPRLFNNKLVSFLDPLKETENILLNYKSRTVYAHVIDVLNNSQSREFWCPIGKGILPYRSIISLIKKLNINIPLWVLEDENEKNIKESIEYFYEKT